MSIIVDLGSIEGVKAGDLGVFFSKDTIGTRTPMEVAKGEAIKVYPDYSFWFLSKIRNLEELQKGNILGLISESEVRKGRRKAVFGSSSVILTNKQNAKNHKVDEKSDFPKEFVRGQGDFEVGYENVTETKLDKNHDYKRTNYFEWVDGELAAVDGFEQKIRFKVKKKYPKLKNVDEIDQKVRQEIFDAYVESAVYKDRDQVIEIDRIASGKNYNPDNTFNQYVEHTQREKEISAEALRKIKRDNGLWSTGMNDQELRRYIIDSGLQSEVKRRERVLEEKLDHEFQLRYSQGVASNATATGEKENLTPKHMVFGYEAYLKRVSNYFDRFTFGIFIENGLGYYENNNLNLRAEEISFRADLSYYFMRPPTTLRKVTPFVSVGTKFGTATVENSYLSNSYIYQVRALPSLTLGAKYRFHAGDEFNDYVHMGFGALFAVTYERLEFSTAEVLRDENIYESFVKNSIKAQAGVSFYF